jgi:hypothetical protein
MLDVPASATRCLNVKTQVAKGGEFSVNLPKIGIYYMPQNYGFTFPPKEGVLRIFFDLKNPTASTEFQRANSGNIGQHATSRPPKPHRHIKVVRLSALRTCRLYLQEYAGTHFERLSRPRAHGLVGCLEKNPQ